MADRCESDGGGGALPLHLSAVQTPGASLAAVADASAVNISPRPQALVGTRIPSRNQHTRDLVVRLYEENLHLQRADLLAVTRYAELCWKFRRLSELQERMGDTAGYLRADLEPRKILAELRQMADSLLRHEAALALVPSARAALGVDIGKMRALDLAAGMSRREGE